MLLRRQADLEAQLMNAIEQNQNQTAGREKPPYKGRHSIDDEELMLTEVFDPASLLSAVQICLKSRLPHNHLLVFTSGFGFTTEGAV